MRKIRIIIFSLLICCVWNLSAGKSLYPAIRNTVFPNDKTAAMLNPPNLQWPRVDDKTAVFKVELSTSPDFSSDRIESQEIRYCFFNPHQKLKNGKWYWRYTTIVQNQATVSPVYTFEITDDTPVFVTPAVETLVKNLPKERPYMLSFGQPHAKIIETAKKYPHLAAEIIRKGDKAAALPILDLTALRGECDKIGLSAYLRSYTPQARAIPELGEAYLVTGDIKYYHAVEKRIEQHLAAPRTDNMEWPDRVRYFALAYDTFYQCLNPELKSRMLDAIHEYLEKQYSWWPGDKESLFLENHFWQVQVSGFFIAALATVADRPENIKYLEYAYGIFLTRAPVAGGNDGGWANGLAYFTVNFPTLGDMAYYIYSVGKVNVFEMSWYRNLPAYFLYCAMPRAPMDGFGNMHDRAYEGLKNNGIGWNFGKKFSQYIAAATGNPLAKLYCSLTADIMPMLELSLGGPQKFEVRPEVAASLPQARQFREVGVTAMHTDLMNPGNDMAVYFRSSPFGNHGHMHANQNAFNIAYKGERIFYSSGYYTKFDDQHGLICYRHTQAHNTILIDGKGQSYGPEGYGWLKRFAHGRNISYVCGDASNAYVEVTNPMWLKNVRKALSEAEQNRLFGDAKLKKFDRHLVFLRPNTVLIYDELESEIEHDWTFLMHTYKKSEKSGSNTLEYRLPGSASRAQVFGSQNLDMTITDQFEVDPRTANPRYRNATNQYHISWKSTAKSNKMRFFAVIQCADSENGLMSVAKNGNEYRFGQYTVAAELDTDKPASLVVNGKDESVQVKASGTLVKEQIDGHAWQELSTDTPPRLAH